MTTMLERKKYVRKKFYNYNKKSKFYEIKLSNYKNKMFNKRYFTKKSCNIVRKKC